MARQLQNMKDDVNVMLRDKTNGTVESSDLTVHFNKSLRTLKIRNEYQGTKRRHEFDAFSGIYEYPLPAGYKAPRDVYPRDGFEDFQTTTEKQFRENVSRGARHYSYFAKGNVNEQDIALVYAKGSACATLDDLNGNNGTWTAIAGTDATNVRIISSTRFSSGQGYVFDIDVSASVTDTAGIQSTDFSAVTLTDHESLSTLFVDISLPDATNITGVTLRWGSGAGNYWEQSVTSEYSGIDFRDGRNVCGFDWATASVTGNPDASAVTFAYVLLSYDAAQTDMTAVGVSNLRSCLPVRYVLDYYSAFMVKANDGTYKEEFTADDDVSILEDWEDEILVEGAAMGAFRQMRDFDDMSLSLQQHERLFAEQANDNPSEEAKPTTSYYNLG